MKRFPHRVPIRTHKVIENVNNSHGVSYPLWGPCGGFLEKTAFLRVATDLTSLVSRASAYVATMPPAISGNHGHDATFAVALALCHGFALSNAQALPVMHEFNARCDPRWNERELEHKLESASKVTRHPRQRGYLWANAARSRRRRKPGQPKRCLTSTRTSRCRARNSTAVTGRKLRRSAPAPSIPAEEQLTAVQLTEARRIAGELVKLYHAGAIKGANDPQAVV